MADSFIKILIQQLGNNGRMIPPLGQAFQAQELVLIEKDNMGAPYQQDVLPVIFVPLSRSC